MPVLLKAALALSLISLASAVPPDPDYLTFVDYPLVHRVDCFDGWGTAFRVGPHRFLSVAHVTAMRGCSIDGHLIQTVESDGDNDFAQIDAGWSKRGKLDIDCGGFVPGRWYYAVGHARGAEFQVMIALYATYARDSVGKRVLIGPYNVIPGMSGGPIMDGDGRVVGLVNSYFPGTAISLSRELKDTSVCQRA